MNTRSLTFTLFILLIAGAQLGTSPAHTQPPDSTAIQISNLRDVSFSLSWTTPVTSTARHGTMPELGQTAIASAIKEREGDRHLQDQIQS